MTAESDRLCDPVARQFHGYADTPIHLGRNLHLDRVGDRWFVGEHPDEGLNRIYVGRDELIAAARAVLRHFGATP